MLRKPDGFYREGSKVFHKTAVNRVNINGWISISKGKIADAQRESNSPTTRIGAAYDAVFNLSLAKVGAEGWRVTSAEGHHAQTLEAACALSEISQSTFDDIDALRDLRNDQYQAIEPTTADIEFALKVLQKAVPALLSKLNL